MITEYVLTEQDIKGPYLEKLPTKMEDMRSLKALSYTGPKEAISERFHMGQDLLAALNPAKKFDHAGDKIHVVNVSQDKLRPRPRASRSTRSAKPSKPSQRTEH